MKDVTNSKKDWNDFWYNSDSIHPTLYDNNYNELVDFQVQSMNKSEPPFDTQSYANYKALVDKEREKIDSSNLTETIMQLGFQIDQKLQGIIDKLDDILEDKSGDAK